MGTVTDTSGNKLTGVDVRAQVLPDGAEWHATTTADGKYTLAGLPAGTGYGVCFSAGSATGGTSDESGYISQCWANQPGRVTDIEGNALMSVGVVLVAASGDFAYLQTDGEGYFTAPRLRPDDYEVCFLGDTAMQRSSGATGYVDECWKDLSPGDRETHTPVVVTSGATTGPLDVVLSRNTARLPSQPYR